MVRKDMQLVVSEENFTLEIRRMDGVALDLLDLYIASLKAKQTPIERPGRQPGPVDDMGVYPPELREAAGQGLDVQPLKNLGEKLTEKKEGSKKIGRPRKNLINASEKTCLKCKHIKPLDSFNRLKKAKDGRQTYCRQCQSIINEAFNKIRPPRKIKGTSSEKSLSHKMMESSDGGEWDTVEENKMQDLFFKLGGAEKFHAAGILPNRSLDAIKNKARNMGLIL